jgi:hypothetical protein
MMTPTALALRFTGEANRPKNPRAFGNARLLPADASVAVGLVRDRPRPHPGLAAAR